MKIRIVVADDQESLRNSVQDLLAKMDDMEVVAMAADGRQAVELTRAMAPDLVVMDVEMPHMNGIEATRRIVSEFPAVKVIALSLHADKRLVAEMLLAGASEYVLKDVAYELLAAAIRAATGGRHRACAPSPAAETLPAGIRESEAQTQGSPDSDAAASCLR